MQVLFDHSQAESQTIQTFYFKPAQPVHYTAGQFTQLTLPHPHPDHRGNKHWFTLSSSPSDDLLAITTKFSAEQSSTFKQALRDLRPGQAVHMDEPMGDFVLPKLLQTPLVFVAGGIGITPFRSMFRWLSSSGEQRPIKFIYGVRSEEEIVFQPDIEAAGVHATIVVSQPSAAWGGERGNITAEMILGLEQPSAETLIYLSGPEPMIEHLRKDLAAKGVNKQQLVTDYFPGYSAM